jgi:hypothetical protein
MSLSLFENSWVLFWFECLQAIGWYVGYCTCKHSVLQKSSSVDGMFSSFVILKYIFLQCVRKVDVHLDLIVSIEVAVEVCCCFIVRSC